jgi:hypothetical protein
MHFGIISIQGSKTDSPQKIERSRTDGERDISPRVWHRALPDQLIELRWANANIDCRLCAMQAAAGLRQLADTAALGRRRVFFRTAHIVILA